ncbi:beta-galactosidase trimerization domain-containing protein [Singulisphaera acidiphila]|uniref:Beta-galactosidase trimerisation domain-containing protein n=1 Tax=Singulisphaera acidiphila (strain ATCC BAA-1392 / DSM 18658 / VKM B-2454 / MOB10) TaxID=886293 RepID=L0DK30_SINAD|nr:beta-galactosidase trimerization domain-containing protein [Singulisphaera acidiphila]AGA29612.1 Beta-galactosidase trimerisation domain-containing protein [Singulisphaera acidiphila DSM 18658]
MSRTAMLTLLVALLIQGSFPAVGGETPAPAPADAYARYIETASEFRPVSRDPKVLAGRWNTWLYMPWRYRWSIGTGDAGGRFCRDYGINGGFTDHGEGPLDWLARWELPFYNDHTAGKGDLYLRGAEKKANFQAYQRDPRAVRQGADGPRPLDSDRLRQVRDRVTTNITRLRTSPQRVAYALDDEISWGALVTPLPWRLNDGDATYQRWLDTYYGGKAPKAEYVTPDFVLDQLNRPLGQLDFSPLLDRLTYNDSTWAYFLGELVEHANRTDPTTPCGFVGGQSPSIWGGYDYAKLSKKIQFIEAYDLGSAQEILRSFNPGNAWPQVTTHFHNEKLGTDNDIWQSWYYFAHGNRGMIGWVDESWFNGTTPRPWLDRYKATLRELGSVQGPKLNGARWIHDGVAIYYSHPSIQVSWCLDIEPHGKTWVNRNDDHRLGTSHNVRKAWEYLLADSGVQYNFLAYDELIRRGVPGEYQVLILPACYALSDVEAKRINEFCQAGGTVIADFACGLFDQHGKARKRGALDDLFGVAHDGGLTKRDLFGGALWVETNQDAGYDFKRYRTLFETVNCRLEGGFAVAERRTGIQNVRRVGRGTAVYLNLSPQRYLQYREEGTTTDAHRSTFLRHVIPDGRPPRVVVTRGGQRPPQCEVTYWTKGDRTYVFIFRNVPVNATPTGGGGAVGLATSLETLDVELAADVRDAINERSGKALGAGRNFQFSFHGVEPVFFSFAAP